MKTAFRGDKRWPPNVATSCDVGGTRTSCPSEINPVKSFFDFIGLIEATSSPYRLQLDNSDSNEIKKHEVRE
ncbi:hypothetical protein J6TS1_33850 [Siminovitchia terrae]|uniref:Uncharacterized protein n=1 Tax=Siminovitchia terrae TaxID=1914933 RepID=A0ABQ4L106_SIMTE|nr:hypothetical protein J22TS1_39640 [Siminovitchia terrae]GIN97515.1 hypothetical protein J6TS1_33850 [Siminovitchia terrae]